MTLATACSDCTGVTLPPSEHLEVSQAGAASLVTGPGLTVAKITVVAVLVVVLPTVTVELCALL